MFDSKLIEIVAHLPVLANATRVTPLGGLTNTNYCVETQIASVVPPFAMTQSDSF